MGQQDHGKDPSPEEIQAACLELQSNWTENEERSRRTGTSVKQHYTIPMVMKEEFFPNMRRKGKARG